MFSFCHHHLSIIPYIILFFSFFFFETIKFFVLQTPSKSFHLAARFLFFLYYFFPFVEFIFCATKKILYFFISRRVQVFFFFFSRFLCLCRKQGLSFKKKKPDTFLLPSSNLFRLKFCQVPKSKSRKP